MMIGINGNEANVEHRVGVGQYAFELLRHLPKDKIRVYLSAAPRSDMPDLNYQVLPGRGLWTLTTLQHELLGTRDLDVFFTPSHYTPLFLPMPSVISIMDMAFERFPQFFKKRDLYQLRYWSRFSTKQAKKVLTISQFCKDEICGLYNFSPEKIIVTYPGYDATRFKPLRTKTDDYFLFLGTLQPRKNLVRLLEAFSRLSNQNVKLKIVGMINEGRGGWMHEGIFAKVKELNLEKQVEFTGFVSDSAVPDLMRHAIAFVLPSLYEGFGIPPIEAMAAGVPVVVSQTSSLPEICGQAAVYIRDPYKVESIQQALQEVLRQTSSQRAKRIELGLAWVKRYNWETCAKQTLKVLYDTAQR